MKWSDEPAHREAQTRRVLMMLLVGWSLMSLGGVAVSMGLAALAFRSVPYGYPCCGLSFVVSSVAAACLFIYHRGATRLNRCRSCRYVLSIQSAACPRCSAPLEHCIQCGYLLIGDDILRCPECGERRYPDSI
jgi:RNA polymerase subunit RPABC4/transcription elongation factor Spt4